MTTTKRNKQKSIRAASERMAERKAAIAAREKKVTAALAEYLEHATAAEDVMAQARQRAAAILAAGENDARSARSEAGGALAVMEQLGETRAAIAKLAGLSVGEVRAALADASAGHPEAAQAAVPGPD